MKVRSYPGRVVLEDPELLLDPDATRGRTMELLYEASWRECGVNWTNSSRSSSRPEDKRQQPYARVISQLEGVLEAESPSSKEARSPRSSGEHTTDSETSEPPVSNTSANGQSSGFLIPRPRLIVPVHTYARRRRTGAPPARRRQDQREGIIVISHPRRTKKKEYMYIKNPLHVWWPFARPHLLYSLISLKRVRRAATRRPRVCQTAILYLHPGPLETPSHPSVWVKNGKMEPTQQLCLVPPRLCPERGYFLRVFDLLLIRYIYLF